MASRLVSLENSAGSLRKVEDELAANSFFGWTISTTLRVASQVRTKIQLAIKGVTTLDQLHRKTPQKVVEVRQKSLTRWLCIYPCVPAAFRLGKYQLRQQNWAVDNSAEV
jgi:hypothetical protein